MPRLHNVCRVTALAHFISRVSAAAKVRMAMPSRDAMGRQQGLACLLVPGCQTERLGCAVRVRAFERHASHSQARTLANACALACLFNPMFLVSGRLAISLRSPRRSLGPRACPGSTSLCAWRGGQHRVSRGPASFLAYPLVFSFRQFLASVPQDRARTTSSPLHPGLLDPTLLCLEPQCACGARSAER